MPQQTPLPPVPTFALSLEGRLLAHRRLLVELMRSLRESHQAELMDWLEDRSIYRDGQEDPGAVPSEGVALELARADEFRLLKRLLGGLDPD